MRRLEEKTERMKEAFKQLIAEGGGGGPEEEELRKR
jgi:hypothetical protein